MEYHTGPPNEFQQYIRLNRKGWYSGRQVHYRYDEKWCCTCSRISVTRSPKPDSPSASAVTAAADPKTAAASTVAGDGKEDSKGLFTDNFHASELHSPRGTLLPIYMLLLDASSLLMWYLCKQLCRTCFV